MPPRDPDDDGLIARARAGDRSAFAELVKKNQRRVYRMAFHMTGSHSDADDVTQEALLRAYRGLGGFDGRAELGTWLTRIVINAALNHLRARRRERPAELPEELEAGGEDPGRTAESRELVRAVLIALSELSPSLRVTLVLATIEHMPYRDIAAALGVPEGTVAWRVNQARKLLRLSLGSVAGGHEKGNVDEVLRRTRQALGAP